MLLSDGSGKTNEKWDRVSVAWKSKVSSDFSRRTFVEDGLVGRNYSAVGSSGRSDRVWTVSSLKHCLISECVPGQPAVCAWTFEKGSELLFLGSDLSTLANREFYRSILSSIAIPSSVGVLRKESFKRCHSLEFVLFENGSRIERIEASAFRESGLRSIVIPSSVIVLGESSFVKCRSLDCVLFETGSRLDRIEAWVFYGSGLNSIVIPPRVTMIDGSAFHGLAVTSISVSRDNESFHVREEFLEHVPRSMLCCYFGCCDSVVIPSSIVILGKSCFQWSKALKCVHFQSGSRLERIEESAFGSSGLNSIVIPSSVLVLGRRSFQYCESLGSVIFESGSRLQRMEEFAFSRSRIASIVIPSSVVVLGKEVFHHCGQL
jgi:hypothetical protein